MWQYRVMQLIGLKLQFKSQRTKELAYRIDRHTIKLIGRGTKLLGNLLSKLIATKMVNLRGANSYGYRNTSN